MARPRPRPCAFAALLSLVTSASAFRCTCAVLFSFSVLSAGTRTTVKATQDCLAVMGSRDRARAAIVGAFVADAATMPLHWIYDQGRVAEMTASAPSEFFDPPSCAYYTYELGKLSPYGDELLPVARTMAATGAFEAAQVAPAYYEFFSTYPGRLNHVSKLFLSARDSGKDWSACAVDDHQAHGIIKVPLIVGRYAGSPELLTKVEEAVRTTQSDELSVAASKLTARLLEKLVMGVSATEALEWARSTEDIPVEEKTFLDAIAESEGNTFSAAVAAFGLSCQLPGALKGPLASLTKFTSYTEAVRGNILAAGDNCSRGIVIGAFFAASSAGSDIPPEWIQKTAAYEEIAALAEQIVAANPSLA